MKFKLGFEMSIKLCRHSIFRKEPTTEFIKRKCFGAKKKNCYRWKYTDTSYLYLMRIYGFFIYIYNTIFSLFSMPEKFALQLLCFLSEEIIKIRTLKHIPQLNVIDVTFFLSSSIIYLLFCNAIKWMNKKSLYSWSIPYTM